jgi:hypothetical protein
MAIYINNIAFKNIYFIKYIFTLDASESRENT